MLLIIVKRRSVQNKVPFFFDNIYTIQERKIKGQCLKKSAKVSFSFSQFLRVLPSAKVRKEQLEITFFSAQCSLSSCTVQVSWGYRYYIQDNI